MKKTLIATMFLLSILPAIGQDTLYKKTIPGPMGDTVISGSFPGRLMNSFTIKDFIGSGGGTVKPDRDTIRVVMLVCDTTSLSWTDTAIVNNKLVPVGEPRKIYELRFAKWEYGYSVREFAGHYNAVTPNYLIYSEEPFYKHIEYLGEDKKPLFNKIVWMAKEVGK
jgi:hypothetical protein